MKSGQSSLSYDAGVNGSLPTFLNADWTWGESPPKW